MISREIIELRSIQRRMAELAERLYGQTIGCEPITKKDAADVVYIPYRRLKDLTGDNETKTEPIK